MVCGAVCAAIFAAPCYAGRISPVVDVGVGFGGDRLGEATSGATTESVRAGQFMYFAVGSTFPLMSDGDYELQATLGYFYDSVNANHGQLSFIRYPIEALVFKSITPKWRAGGGPTYHFNPERKCSMSQCDAHTVKFKNALGVVMEADYVLGEGGLVSRTQGADGAHSNTVWLGLRYTVVNYKTTEADGIAANGSARGNAFAALLGVNF